MDYVFSGEINNGIRVEESLLLKLIIERKKIGKSDFIELIYISYGYKPSEETITSAVRNLNFRFITEKQNGKLVPVGQYRDIILVEESADEIIISNNFDRHINNQTFKQFLLDATEYSIEKFKSGYNEDKFFYGFILYKKYTRKDVFRILNWSTNPVAQNVGGYIISFDLSTCPIFVTYHKKADIASTTKYEDRFLNPSTLEWVSKNRRILDSKDVLIIRNHRTSLRLPLFIQKNNDEGNDFYYMGDVIPDGDTFRQDQMKTDKCDFVSVVILNLKLNVPVEHSLYKYLME